MRIATGLLQFGTGASYLIGVGLLSALGVWRQYRRSGLISWFGLGLVGMALSCGPHHMHLAFHELVQKTRPTALDFATILVALPFGVIWLYYRAKAEFGWEPFDRKFRSDWLSQLLFTGVSAYTASIVPLAIITTKANFHGLVATIPQVLLFFLYGIISIYLWTGQQRQHALTGQWSTAGLALTFIFPTCAVQHLVYAASVSRGHYPGDAHFAAIDWFGVAAAGFFIGVLHHLRHPGVLDDTPLGPVAERRVAERRTDDVVEVAVEQRKAQRRMARKRAGTLSP